MWSSKYRRGSLLRNAYMTMLRSISMCLFLCFLLTSCSEEQGTARIDLAGHSFPIVDANERLVGTARLKDEGKCVVDFFSINSLVSGDTLSITDSYVGIYSASESELCINAQARASVKAFRISDGRQLDLSSDEMSAVAGPGHGSRLTANIKADQLVLTERKFY